MRRPRRLPAPLVIVVVSFVLLGLDLTILLVRAQAFLVASRARHTPLRFSTMSSAPPASGGSSGGSGSQKLKVLALHGFMQSGQVFREKTGSFRKSLKAHIGEVVWVDGPYPAQTGGAAAAEEQGEEGGSGGGGGRSWWRWTDEKGGDGAPVERPSKALFYTGVDEALALLRGELNAHRPDALLGFSQGATAAALLLASLAAGQEQQEQHVPRFAILAGGFVPRDPKVAALLTASPPQVPTLFISGEGDQLVPPERTRALMECFAGETEIALHPGGHFIPPAKGEMKEKVAAFIERHS